MLKVSNGIWGQNDLSTCVKAVIIHWSGPSGLPQDVWPAGPEVGMYSQEDKSDVLPGNWHKVNNSSGNR